MSWLQPPACWIPYWKVQSLAALTETTTPQASCLSSFLCPFLSPVSSPPQHLSWPLFPIAVPSLQNGRWLSHHCSHDMHGTHPTLCDRWSTASPDILPPPALCMLHHAAADPPQKRGHLALDDRVIDLSILAGPTTFEGIANSLKLAKDAVATSASTGPPPSGQSSPQDAGPASKVCTDARQPDRTLESALSRLGGMLESAGPLTDQACSQLEVPAGQTLVSLWQLHPTPFLSWLLWLTLMYNVIVPSRKFAPPAAYRSCHTTQKYTYIFWGLCCTEVPGRGSGAGWPQSTTSSGNASFPSGRASRAKDTSGLSPARHCQSTVRFSICKSTTEASSQSGQYWATKCTAKLYSIRVMMHLYGHT